MKIKNILFIAALIILLSFSSVFVKAGTFEIKLTPNKNENGSVSISWEGYDYHDKTFRVYKSFNGGNKFESVGIDYTLVNEVRVLQIYPDVGAGQLKSWVENTGYGQGIIKVNEVSISSFNKNPSAYLYQSENGWNYDVLFFGTWDRNNCRDLSATSYQIVDKFIKSGHGAIFGHDTIVCRSLNKYDTYEWTGGPVKASQEYFNALTNNYMPILFYQSSASDTYGTQVNYPLSKANGLPASQTS